MARHIIKIITVLILIFFIPLGVWALKPPHDISNNIGCEDCHAMHKSGGMMGGAIISRGAEQETLCKTCHNPTGQAASMSNVSNHMVNGGTMIVDCGSCHDPHKPMSPLSNPVLPDDYNLSLIRPNVTKYIDNALEPAYFLVRPENFAFYTEPYNGICQACHNTTDHFRNTAELPTRNTPTWVSLKMTTALHVTNMKTALPTAAAAAPAAAGQYWSVAVKQDGTVWTWGHDNWGVLGNDMSHVDKNLPVQVKVGDSSATVIGNLTDITAVTTGTTINLALKSDGTLWTWGENSDGRLGNNSTTDAWSPVEITIP